MAAEPLDESQVVFLAALQGDTTTLKLRLREKDARTPEGYTPLSLATSAGHHVAIMLLLREGANPNKHDRAGVTALMLAAMHGYGAIIDLLLLHGASRFRNLAPDF